MEFTEIGCNTVKSYDKGENWVAELAEGLGSFSAGTLLGGAIMTALGVIDAPLLIVIAVFSSIGNRARMWTFRMVGTKLE